MHALGSFAPAVNAASSRNSDVNAKQQSKSAGLAFDCEVTWLRYAESERECLHHPNNAAETCDSQLSCVV